MVMICGIAGENRPTGTKFQMEIIAIKEIFGKNFFIGYSCYISHGLPSDTLTVDILLNFLRYGPFFIMPLVAISRIRSRAQTPSAVY